jgi:hypothetical protein
VSVRLGGYYDSRGYVHVSSADWLDDDHSRGRRDDRYRDDRYRDGDRRGDRRDDFVSGVVERVDRRGTILIRDQRTGRRVTAVMARGNHRRGVDINDLRRGDRVTLRGDWERGGVFEVYRIEDLRSGRH